MTSNKDIWPEAFVQRIRSQFPDMADSFLESLSHDAGTSVRINPRKFKAAAGTGNVPWCTTGIFLPERPRFALDPLWHAGAYYVQEASSMFLEQIIKQINTDHPLTVLDLCAAPGGKSTHLSTLLSPDDLIVSNEVIRSRVPVLNENISKWGYSNVLTTSSDARQFGNAGPLFDVLVIDAPCSGEGLFRRAPEAAGEWSVANAELCAIRQRRILADSWACLKDGGYLIYSTCTFNPAENEENLHWLRSHGNFSGIRVPLDPQWQADELEYQGIYAYRFLPSKVKGEGFFIALLQKQETTPPLFLPSKFKNRLQKTNQVPPHWILKPETKKFFQHQDQLKFIPAHREAEILYLFETIHVIKAGTTAGQLIRNDVLPDHELAMSVDLNTQAFPRTELKTEDALKYLGRERFKLEPANTAWQLVTFRDTPLGFIKNLDKRFNNYYPKSWRLRMQTDVSVPLWYDRR